MNIQDEANGPTNLLAARIHDALRLCRWNLETIELISPNSMNETARLVVVDLDGVKHRITVNRVHSAPSG